MASKDGTKVVDEVARQVRSDIFLYMDHVGKVVERNESSLPASHPQCFA